MQNKISLRTRLATAVLHALRTNYIETSRRASRDIHCYKAIVDDHIL